MELDIQTLYLVGGVVTTCGAGATLLTWYHHRNAPGLLAWATALFMTTAGAIVLQVWSSPTAVGYILVADTMIVAGFAVMWMSLRLHNQRRADYLHLAAVTAAVGVAFLALYGLAAAAGAGRRAAAIPFSLFLGMLALASAYEIWRGRRSDGVRSRLPTALAFAGLGLARLVRAAALAFEMAGISRPGSASIVHPYTLYMTVICILCVTYGLVMMANERAARYDAALSAGDR